MHAALALPVSGGRVSVGRAAGRRNARPAPPPSGLCPGRARRRAAPVATLSYSEPVQQQWQQPQRQAQQGPPSEQQSVEELQRAVQQLQADNAELQAELQHLATTLKAALAAAPDGGSGTAAASLGGSIDLSAAGVQQLDGFPAPHDHTHLQLGTCTNGCGDSHDSQSLTASMLSSVDTSPAALENAEEPNGAGGLPAGQAAVSVAGLGVAPVYHQPTAVSRATLSCSMQHPGSICCTKLSSTVDPSGAACTISLHTTARCTADDSTVHRHLAPEELRALAAHALVGAAHSFSQAATADYRAHMGPAQEVANAHTELHRILQEGVVICAERTPPSQFDHKSYLLTLQDPHTAVRVRAIYKPRVYGDAGGWHRTPMEWVAYRLNQLLGLDLVPPVAYRTAPLTLCLSDEDEELVFQEGAMMLWVENCKQLKEFKMEQWGVDPEVLLSDTRVLDVLLHNSDRHHGHFLLGPHWAVGTHGDGRFEGSLRPVLIDHAASFRREAVVSMEHENAFATGAVRCVSASTYLRLRFLDAHTVSEELGQHLSRAEQRQLLHRRDYVLHYFDDLVATQGYSATVRE